MNILPLIVPELDDAVIRRTGTGLYSVFDVLKACGAKNPRDAFKRICDVYSEDEVVAKCDNFQFPGRGQRPTPVANEKTLLIIIGLCPGVIGKTYRSFAGDTVARYLKGDVTLASEIVERCDDLEALTEHQQVVEKRISFIKGVDYAEWNDEDEINRARWICRNEYGLPDRKLKAVFLKTEAAFSALGQFLELKYPRIARANKSLEDIEALAAYFAPEIEALCR